MRRINNLNSILDFLRETFPLKIEVVNSSELSLDVAVPYFPSSLCRRISSSVVYSVHPNGDNVLISFYIL